MPEIITMKHFILTLFTLGTALLLQAQKLPAKQEKSLLAPVEVKVDGKLTEWGNLTAYNTTTDLYYTLANDKEYLYLAIKVGSKATRAKVFGAGITLIFANNSKPDKSADGSISFMGFPKDKRFEIDELMKDTIANDLKIVNRAVTSALKIISVKNLDGVNGDAIPVYNEYGIMAASYIGSAGSYTCEIAIPLKHLKSFINLSSSINYTLQSNAQSLNNMKMVVNGKIVEDAATSPQMVGMFNKILQSDNASSLRELMSDTNFSGVYPLAK